MLNRQPSPNAVVPIERATQHNYIISELCAKPGATINFSIPKSAVDPIKAVYKAGAETRTDKQHAIQSLWSAVQICKISVERRVDRKLTDLGTEINILRTLPPHPNIVALLAGDDASDLGRLWLTMPVYSSRTLQHVLNATASVAPGMPSLPAGLAWSICAQAADIYLFLHHGVDINGVKDVNRGYVTHNDGHTDNFLFEPCTPAGVPDQFNYRTLVLIDFGQADCRPNNCGLFDRRAVQRQQGRELTFLAEHLHALGSRADKALHHWSGHLYGAGAEGVLPQKRFEILNKLAQKAKARVAAAGQPLDQDTAIWFEAAKVSDQDLERLL